MWNEATITNAGMAAYNRWVGGAALTLTSVKGGDTVTANPKAATDLVNTKQTLSILGTEPADGGHRVRVQITSEGLTAGYTLRQVGIWGKIGNETPALLILLQDAAGVPVPSATDNADFVFELGVFLQAVSSGSFSAVIDPQALVSSRTLTAAVSAHNTSATAHQDIRLQLTSPFNFKGDVADMTALNAIQNPAQNDTYYVVSLMCRYSWTGSAWAQSSLDESDYEDNLSDLKSSLGYNSIIVDGSYNNSYVWITAYYGMFVKVSPGDKYSITGGNVSTTPYAGLKSVTIPPEAGSAENFSDVEGWTEPRIVAKNGTEDGTVPSDVGWLYFYAGQDTTYNRLPSKLNINGVDVYKNCFDNLRNTGLRVENVNNRLSNIEVNIEIVKGSYNNSYTWITGYYSVFLRVKPGSKYKIQAPLSKTSLVYFLKSATLPPTAGSIPDFSDDPGWVGANTISANAEIEGNIPSDTNYIYFYAGMTTEYDRLPAHIIINNIDYIETVNKNIKNLGDLLTETLDIACFARNIEDYRTTWHGGYAYTYPANSLASFRDAKVRGFTWVETDVQFTYDDIPVLCHDDGLYTYARNPDGSRVGTSMEDTVFISDITYEQLQYYDFGLAKSEAFAGMKITSFEQLMATARHLGLGVEIEMKTDATYEQINILFGIIDKYNMRKNVEFGSGGRNVLRRIHSVDPMATLAYVYSSINDNNVAFLVSIKGKNIVRLNTSVAQTDENIDKLKQNGILLGFGVCNSASDFFIPDAYTTEYMSNGLLADEVFLEYEVSQLPS